ncbi:MAG: aminotransferase class III-fold pyridoxal phosphate-dependent enzyme, partial [Sporichthyaceae bacterium]
MTTPPRRYGSTPAGPSTLSEQDAQQLQPPGDRALAKSAHDHLWMHFTRMSTYDATDVPVIVRGDGPYIYDDKGKRYLDGLAGLFVVQAGHGRTELAEAAAKQASELAFFPLWSYAHPKAVELAERLAHL